MKTTTKKRVKKVTMMLDIHCPRCNMPLTTRFHDFGVVIVKKAPVIRSCVTCGAGPFTVVKVSRSRKLSGYVYEEVTREAPVVRTASKLGL